MPQPQRARERPGGATLRDIAKVVGLSLSAVSMALHDHPRIGADTKVRVREVARSLGYVPNSAGLALRAQRSGSLALIVPNTGQHVFGHAYFMHVLTGVSQVANERDSQLVISTNPDELHGMAAYERVLRSGSVDGALITSASVHDPNIARLVDSGLPIVLLGRFPHIPTAVSVGADDEGAAFQVTEHLIAVHGRKALLHLSGPLDHQSAIDRRNGFIAATMKHGVKARVLEGDYSEISGSSAASAIRGDDRPDGIFAANDEMAFGIMTALAEQGLTTPQEVSVVGFDDFGLSRVTTPSITTVHVPAERMARLATERLFDLMAGVPIDDAHLELPVSLVVRESCGC